MFSSVVVKSVSRCGVYCVPCSVSVGAIWAQRIAGGSNSQISRQLTHEFAKLVNPNYRPPLPPRKYPWYPFLLDTEYAPRSIGRLEGLCQWKIPVTPSGIEAATCIAVPQINEQLPSQYFVKRSTFSVCTNCCTI